MLQADLSDYFGIKARDEHSSFDPIPLSIERRPSDDILHRFAREAALQQLLKASLFFFRKLSSCI